MSRTLDEGRTDIFADPILADACSLDIRRHCVDVPPGLGRSECNYLVRLKVWYVHKMNVMGHESHGS